MRKKCEAEVGLLNPWFDPIDPLGRLSATEICETQFNIIDTSASFAASVTTSYLTSVKVYCREFEESDYEDCVNVEAEAHPNQWATQFVLNHPGFLPLDANQKMSTAANTAEIITSQCKLNKSCDGCAIGIASVYKSFDNYLENLM